VFEWFDFVVYGFFAVTLAEVFFPDPATRPCRCSSRSAPLASPMSCAIGRDRRRRLHRPRRPAKAGLLLSMALDDDRHDLMAGDAGYATIGLAAPIIITLARLLQDFRFGGEFGSASPSWPSNGGGAPRGSAPAGNSATGGISLRFRLCSASTLTTLLTHQEWSIGDGGSPISSAC